MRRVQLCFFVLLISFLSFCSIEVAEATDVTWTEGENDPKNRAHTAPKSQKYWDEHGIERPDYAKTDAEIAQERGSGGGGSAIKWFILVFILVGAGYYFYLQMGGHKLGGSHAGWFHRTSDEEAK